MAYASIASRTEYALTSDGDPSPTFVQTTGDLVVIFLALSTPAQTITIPGDWTNLSAANAILHVIYKVLDGSEGGTVAVTLATNEKAAAIAYNIQGFDTGQAPVISASSTGTSTTPSAANCIADWGVDENLWLTGFGMAGGAEADDDTWCNSAPTGFGNLVQKTSGVASFAASNCMVACADQELEDDALDADTFSTDQSLLWSARTVVIKPAAAGSSTAPVFRIGSSIL